MNNATQGILKVVAAGALSTAALAHQAPSRDRSAAPHTARGRIRRADSKEQPGSVTLSIGVAAGGSDDTLESLLARADAAL